MSKKKGMQNEANELSEKSMKNVSGGYIVNGPDRKFLLVNDKTGERYGAKFKTKKGAKIVAHSMKGRGFSTEEITEDQWQRLKATGRLN